MNIAYIMTRSMVLGTCRPVPELQQQLSLMLKAGLFVLLQVTEGPRIKC